VIDRVALVTGASRGIGRAIALAYTGIYAHVAVTGRDEHELEVLAGEGRARGATMLAIGADLADPRAPARIVDRVRDEFGAVEILVNAAGVGSSQDPRPIVDFNDDFWDLSFQVNVTAPYLFTKLVLPSMIERQWGRLINIASVNSKVPNMHAVAYTASKHALVGLTKSAALETARFNITSNAICPATTRSKLNDLRLQYDSKRLGVPFEELERNSTPLGRRLEPDEIAALAVFLASDGAAAINGQAINVCAGKVMG